MTINRLLTDVRRLSGQKHIRQLIAITVLLVTIAVFVRFFALHPQYLRQLRHTSIWTILIILAANSLLLLILVNIYRTTIELCGKNIEKRENFLLTAYSSIINFFGPLQSGPGVRAVYLKTRQGIRLRDYTQATLLYYGMFAVINIGFLLIGTRPWWQTLLALLVSASFSIYIIRWSRRHDQHSPETQFSMRGELVTKLAMFTFLQIFIQACVFYFELHSVNPGVHFSQAVSYTGAADLALFVSLTPGAIGIRESFLVFSQSLHHISTGNILSANIIDRSLYVIFLGLLFVLVLSLHAQDKLQIKKLRRQQSENTDQ